MAFTCPRCGGRNTVDPPELGFCRRCDDFTGLCAIGREVACPCPSITCRGAHVARWHVTCPVPGAVSRTVAGLTVLVCGPHASQIDSAGAPLLMDVPRQRR